MCMLTIVSRYTRKEVTRSVAGGTRLLELEPGVSRWWENAREEVAALGVVTFLTSIPLHASFSGRGMLASCSRSTLRRTQNRICIATAHSTNSEFILSHPISYGPCLNSVPAHRHASTATRPTTPRDGSNIPPGPRGGNGNNRSTPVPTPSRIRNEPWSFTPDHSFQSTHHQSAIARYQLRMSKEAEQGNFINCLKLCRDMKKSGVKPSLMLYNDVLKAGAHEGLYLEVEGILDDMRASGIEPDRQSYHHLLSVRSSTLTMYTAV